MKNIPNKKRYIRVYCKVTTLSKVACRLAFHFLLSVTFWYHPTGIKSSKSSYMDQNVQKYNYIIANFLLCTITFT